MSTIWLIRHKCFNRINPNRSIPTIKTLKDLGINVLFQSYQSKQINPDFYDDKVVIANYILFQSYQFRQINPDLAGSTSPPRLYTCFNRINPDRSIPTKYREALAFIQAQFQSYQSKQINPDIIGLKFPDLLPAEFQSYQSRQINPDMGYTVVTGNFGGMFQSYQSKQINPDVGSVWLAGNLCSVSIVSIQTDQSRRYPRVAGRGAALRGRMAEPVFWRND